MLSVLIPTYNHECVLLADEISAQIDAAGLDAEVVVLDDGSTDMKSLADNSVIEQIDHCRYVVLPTNIGIARSRNRLMDEAKGDKLLFLDSDIWPKSDDFIVRYLEASDKADVVVGGIDVATRPWPTLFVSCMVSDERSALLSNDLRNPTMPSTPPVSSSTVRWSARSVSMRPSTAMATKILSMAPPSAMLASPSTI